MKIKNFIMIFMSVFSFFLIFIPNNVSAKTMRTLDIDYDSFTSLYDSLIANNIDTLKNKCYSDLNTDSILITYKKYLSSDNIMYACYDLNTFSIIAEPTLTSAYFGLIFRTTNYPNDLLYYKWYDFNTLEIVSSSISNAATPEIYTFYATDSLPDNSNYKIASFEFSHFSNNYASVVDIPFYSDKEIQFKNTYSSSTYDFELYVNDVLINNNDFFNLYNIDNSIFPNDYNYITYEPILDLSIPKINVDISVPILEDKIPYSFRYNSYFILDNDLSKRYDLESFPIAVDIDKLVYGLNYTSSSGYSLFNNATYYFEIYSGNNIDSEFLLFSTSYHSSDVNNTFTTDKYIDYINKNNTSNILGIGLFNNFSVPDYGLTPIITAPLKILNNLSEDKCSSPKIEIYGTDFSLPCGDVFWKREDISSFVNIYHIIGFGMLSYFIALDILRSINKYKDPDITIIDVIDL